MRPAEKIKRTLVDNGMESTVVETVSRGWENSLIPNPDGKPEPRNRRVEVRIRQGLPEPVAKGAVQAGFSDEIHGLADVVRDESEFENPGFGVVEYVLRPVVAVARLAHGTDVHEVPQIRLEFGESPVEGGLFAYPYPGR